VRIDRISCGPVEIALDAETPGLVQSVQTTLATHGRPWADVAHTVDLKVRRARTVCRETVAGSFLTCGRMRVDVVDEGLRAACPSGSTARFEREAGRWSIDAVIDPSPESVGDLEDLVLLALTTEWRRLGWVPLHAASAISDDACVLICAPSGGGKTTLTTALLHRGWRTLGDDKLLLRSDRGRSSVVAGLVGHMNLHPRTRGWFPEVGDLEAIPRHSVWTEKRRVSIETVWPGRLRSVAHPTHLLVVHRADASGLRLTPLAPGDVVAGLLQQTVIPGHPPSARPIVTTMVAAASRMTGFSVAVGPDLYNDPRAVDALEEALR